ncbi:hypothetical protein GCM10027157_02880 [Corynebacterium aquatimens]
MPSHSPRDLPRTRGRTRTNKMSAANIMRIALTGCEPYVANSVDAIAFDVCSATDPTSTNSAARATALWDSSDLVITA